MDFESADTMRVGTLVRHVRQLACIWSDQHGCCSLALRLMLSSSAGVPPCGKKELYLFVHVLNEKMIWNSSQTVC